MEPHPIPRQITTFEFKLIGFMTLRQFIYLAIFLPAGFIVYHLIPIPVLNLLSAFSIAALGPLIAFVPYNERTLDVWIKNLFRKLFSPSQFYYQKRNEPPDFLKDIYISLHPQLISDYSLAQKHLNAYLLKNKNNTQLPNHKNNIHQLIASPIVLENKKGNKNIISDQKKQALNLNPSQTASTISTTITSEKRPFIFGTIKNNKNFPLPNLLVYIKDKQGKVVRILKTNIHGQFATFYPFSPGNYFIEIKDLSHKYFFDTMEIKVESNNNPALNIVSKEQL